MWVWTACVGVLLSFLDVGAKQNYDLCLQPTRGRSSSYVGLKGGNPARGRALMQDKQIFVWNADTCNEDFMFAREEPML